MRVAGNSLAKRLGLIALASLVAIGLVGSAALSWLLATERGTVWLAGKVLDESITWGSLRGTLASGIHIRNLHVSRDGLDIKVAQLDGQWRLVDMLSGQFTIDFLSAASVDIVLEENSKEDEKPSPWPDLSLPFPVTFKEISLTNLIIRQGSNATEISALTLSAAINPRQIRIEHMAVRFPAGKANLAGRVDNRFPYHSALNTAWQLDLDGQHYQGSGAVRGPITALKLDHQLTTPFVMTTMATMAVASSPQTMAIDGDNISIDMTSHWQGLDLSPQGVSATSSGSMELGGTVANYHLRLETALTAATPAGDRGKEDPLTTLLGEATLGLNARGSLEEARIDELELRTGQGQATFSGLLNWREGLRWAGELAASELNTEFLLPQFPALFSANVHSTGHWHEQRLQTLLDIAKMEGTVHNYPLKGSGRINLNYQGGRISSEIDKLALSLGTNSLGANGIIGEQSNLEWQLDANDLSTFAEGLSGQLQGQGRVSGSLAEIQIQASLNGSKVRLPGWSVDKLHLELMPAKGNDHQFSAAATGLTGGPVSAANISLEGNGSLEKHQLAASFKDPGNQLEFVARGGYGDDGWDGTVSRFSVTKSPIGPWQLQNPAKLAIAPGQIQLSGFCIQHSGEAICADVFRSAQEIQASGRIQGFDLIRLGPWLPPDGVAGGTIDGEFNVVGDGDVTGGSNNFRGSYSLASSNGVLAYVPQGTGNTSGFRREFSISARGNIDKNSLANDIHVTIDNTGELRLALNAGLAAPHVLDGRLTAQLPSLQWLQTLIPSIDEPDGEVDMDFGIGGYLSSPAVNGTLSFSNIAATLPAAGISLRDGKGRVTVDNNQLWQLDASIASGPEPLHFSGSGRIASGRENNLLLHIRGTDVQLVDLPDTQVTASPDLSIAVADGALNITGNLGIPLARVVIRPLPEGITNVSGDEVVVSQEKASNQVLPVTVDVAVELGKDVRLTAYGLNTGLRGKLQLRQENSNPPKARGSISLHDGSYKAYGQKLKVTRGILLFQGAMDNPGLNIVASRETPSATVGLNIGGTARDISSSVFSDPAMPSTEALTVLVTGKPLTDINQSDANKVANAASALGIAQSAWITTRLQSATGLDVLSLKGGDSYEDSSLVAGKYLSSKLFVSYVQSLFTPEGSFILEYRIGEKLGLKAESGEFQSIDLLYRIEH